VDSHPDLPLCREASNFSSLHSSGRFSSSSGRLSLLDQASGFLSKTQIWEDYCNHPDDMDSCPSAFIHMASIIIQIQTSGRANIRYGNCVHQTCRPEDHSLGSDARSLFMEIAYGGCATFRMTGHNRLDAALQHKRSSLKFLEFWSHSCLSGRSMTTV
jgi:hypothetical protein